MAETQLLSRGFNTFTWECKLFCNVDCLHITSNILNTKALITHIFQMDYLQFVIPHYLFAAYSNPRQLQFLFSYLCVCVCV
jgi:hypothetical protein